MAKFSNKDLIKESRSILLVTLGYEKILKRGKSRWEKGDIYCIKGMQSGPLYSYFEGHSDIITYPMGYSIKHKDLLKDLVLVETKDCYSIASTADGLYLQKRGGKINAFTKKIGGGFSNVIDGTEASSEKGMVKYKILFPLEGDRSIFIKDDLDMDILDRSIFNSMISKSKKEMSYPELFKFVARLKQKLAPATKLGIPNMAIILKKLDPKDGSAEQSAQSVQDSFLSRGKLFSIDSLKGVLKQGRVGSAKFAALLQDKRTIMENVLSYDPNPIIVSRDEASQLVSDYLNNKLDPELEGRVIITGDIDLFVDMNCIKAPMDFNDAYLWALDSSKDDQHTATTSMQALFDIIGIEGGKELIRKRILALVNNKMDEIENISNPIYPKFSNKSSFYAVGMIREVAPALAREDRTIISNMISDALFSLSSGIDRFNDIVDGAFSRALPDPAVDYGYHILAVDECLSVDAEVKGFIEIWSIRNPKTTANDSDVQKVVTREEYCKRIDSLDAPINIKKSIKSKVMCLKKGVVVFNTSKRFTSLYGTSDWDFDGFTLIFDKEYVELKKKGQSVIPNIILKDSPDDGQRYSFNGESLRHISMNEVSSQNEPLGVVCNWQHTLLALLEDLPTARKVFKAAFEGGESTKFAILDYIKGEDGLFHVDIDDSIINKIFRSYRFVDFDEITDKSMKRILTDTIHIYVSYIQRTVDSKKTSDIIDILFKVGHYAKAMSLFKMSLKLNRENKIEFSQYGDDVGDDVILFKDFFYQVKEEAFGLLKSRAQKILDKTFSTNEVDLRLMSEAYHKFVGNNASLNYSLGQILYIYNDVDSVTRNKIAKVEKELDDDSNQINSNRAKLEIISLVKSEKKEMLSYLHSMLCKLLPNVSMWEMGAITKKLSRDDSRDTYNKFALSVTPREYVSYIVKSSKDRNLDHADCFRSMLSKVSPEKADALRNIKEIEFKDGESKIGVKSKDDLNGVYNIQEINNRFYATKHIEEVLAEDSEVDYNKISAIISLDNKDVDISAYDNLYMFCNQYMLNHTKTKYRLNDILVGKIKDEYYILGKIHTPSKGDDIISIYDKKEVKLANCINVGQRAIAFFDIVNDNAVVDKDLIKTYSSEIEPEYEEYGF